MADVAKRAKVSVGTVSHVLRHPDRVATGARERVEEAILAMGTRLRRRRRTPGRARRTGADQGSRRGCSTLRRRAGTPRRRRSLLGRYRFSESRGRGSLSEDVTPRGAPRCAGRRCCGRDAARPAPFPHA
ncbi:LacI family DNA-binding transcriptional regulator [Actinomadura sp. NEAU-AAG7]|uniref:LacI family DNA-binding transcriptional regulator n=1 Tax=Actinomadura sp. NEAU-AAG7 TaxID=2839640 RepID=UPI001BE4B007|nr:LacI family DNA-binding transcriptional regulator [Actinomadura sp. NEAU-AAG7]MBT2210180.1 LacI family DNA-binding transcriptional regulator [Actinomadura sp. NEAU-AAG7]